MWCGCYAYEDVALMACIATNGYHSYVEYYWKQPPNNLNIEEGPLLYRKKPGAYTCLVTSNDFELCTVEFCVSGKYHSGHWALSILLYTCSSEW